jgi:hypothetical protein
LPDLPPHDVVVRGRLARIHAYIRSDGLTWEDFLRSLRGRPSIVVADAAGEIAAAVRKVWPSAAGGS